MGDRMVIAGTGHRPENSEGEQIVRTKARAALRYSGADTFICGLAAGFDLWSADEARLLGIEIWAAKPWAGHQARKEDAELYATVIEAASRVVDVTDFQHYPGSWVYQKRNEWMVDHCTHVLAYMNPSTVRGGTWNCLNYARGNKPIRNIYTAPPF